VIAPLIQDASKGRNNYLKVKPRQHAALVVKGAGD
jgi:hypothetical protein